MASRDRRPHGTRAGRFGAESVSKRSRAATPLVASGSDGSSGSSLSRTRSASSSRPPARSCETPGARSRARTSAGWAGAVASARSSHCGARALVSVRASWMSISGSRRLNSSSRTGSAGTGSANHHVSVSNQARRSHGSRLSLTISTARSAFARTRRARTARAPSTRPSRPHSSPSSTSRSTAASSDSRAVMRSHMLRNLASCACVIWSAISAAHRRSATAMGRPVSRPTITSSPIVAVAWPSAGASSKSASSRSGQLVRASIGPMNHRPRCSWAMSRSVSAIRLPARSHAEKSSLSPAGVATLARSNAAAAARRPAPSSAARRACTSSAGSGRRGGRPPAAPTSQAAISTSTRSLEAPCACARSTRSAADDARCGAVAVIALAAPGPGARSPLP